MLPLLLLTLAQAPASHVAPEVALVTRTIAKIREASGVVQAKVQEARDTKDIVKLNCVNEKLTQITALLRVSEQAAPLLKDALLIRDANAVAHESSKVKLAGQKVDLLKSEADECIGQLAFRTDENLVVEVVEPENLYPGDPTRPENDDPGSRLIPGTQIETSGEPVRPDPASPTL